MGPVIASWSATHPPTHTPEAGLLVWGAPYSPWWELQAIQRFAGLGVLGWERQGLGHRGHCLLWGHTQGIGGY